MSYSTRVVHSLFAGVVSLLVTGFVCPQEKSLPAKTDHLDRKTSTVFDEFVSSVDKYIVERPALRRAPVVSEGRRRITPTTGQTVEIGGPQYLAIVSESQGTVTYFLNRNGFPTSHPAIDENGMVVSPSTFKDRTVQIDHSDAERTAVGIRDAAVGRAVTSKLCKTKGELVYRGSYFVYEFSWVECVDSNSLAEFLSRISVMVNPENGDLISFSNITSVPSKAMNSESLERLDLAIRSAVRDKPYSVVRKVPFRFWSEDGTSEDRCAVQYRSDSTETGSIETIVVSLGDFRVVATKDDPKSSGIWDPSVVCP